MRHLKTYENFNFSDIDLYDYVILKFANYPGEEELVNFVSNNIGQVMGKNQISKNSTENTIKIKYENIPYEVLEFFDRDLYGKRNVLEVKPKTIMVHSKSKEELELKLAANKYNI